MTATEAALPAKDPWALRLAIAAHPAWWQARYGDEAAATVADLAGARGGFPRADVAGLLLRGLFLRGRSSMVFWLGLTLIGTEILTTATNYSGFRAERSWGAVFAHAGWGVMPAVPLVAGAAAWAVASHPTAVSVRIRLGNLARSAAAVLGFAAVGYLTIVVLTVIDSGWPTASAFDLGYTAGFAAMTVSAFALGSILGAALPRWLALPAGIGLGLLAMLSDGWQNGDLRWRNVTGSALTFDANWGIEGSSNTHITLVTAAYAAILLVATVVATALRPRPLRVVALVVTLGVVIGGSAAISTPLLEYVGARASAIRSNNELHCAGTAPRICLWPEQEATDGAQVRAAYTDAYRRTVALGYPVTATLTAGFSEQPDAAPAIPIDSTTHLDASLVAGRFAEAVIRHGTCPDQPSRVAPDDESAATLGLALLLGATTNAELTNIAGVTLVNSVTGSPDKLDAAQIRDYFRIHTDAQAKAAVSKWFAERKACTS